MAVGLAAVGSACGWEFAIDESTTGPERWFAQIEGPSTYVYFEIESPQIVDKILEFLISQPNARKRSPTVLHEEAGAMVLSKSHDEPVTLLKDDEFNDRCFLLVEAHSKLVVRLTIAGRDLSSLTSALQQASEDLKDDASA